MAKADWAALVNSLGSGDVAKAVSSAFTPPSGGGTYVHELHEVGGGSATGLAGYYCALTGFNPITGTRKCGQMSCVLKRFSSNINYAPMFGFLAGNDPNSAVGYFVGLSAESSYHVCLKKGIPWAGMLSTDSDVLRVATAVRSDTGATADWVHLRLSVLVEPHGEVRILVEENDLSSYIVTAPTWAAIPGMAEYIDDPAGVLSGSLPKLDGFYPFFGMHIAAASGATVLVDHIQISRQLTP